MCKWAAQVYFYWFQSIGSPVDSSSMVGHVSDHSLSGHSHTFTFSSTEVSLSFSSPFFLTICPLEHFVLPLSPRLFSLISVFFSLPSLASCQTLDDDLLPSNNNNQWQSRPVLEWDNQQVCLWLIAMNMDQYTSEFAARGVDGPQLLNMDSEKLRVSVVVLTVG